MNDLVKMKIGYTVWGVCIGLLVGCVLIYLEFG